jgi:hypothetical protein
MDMNAAKGMGTLYHKEVTGQWYIYDQIIVSSGLTNDTGWSVKGHAAHIFNPEWLLDPATGKPVRSFKGPVFTGGFSDHLPVYVDIEYSDKNN